MHLRQQRPLCLGTIIGNKRPEACIGCLLSTDATHVTEGYAGSIVIPAQLPDLLQELQTIYDAAEDPRDTRRRLAQEVLMDMSDHIIAHLVGVRRSLAECPRFR